MNITPHESDDCKTLVEWMDYQGFRFSHLAQETYTKSWAQKAKNKAMGVRKGVLDYLIIIPQHKTQTKRPLLLFLEMKRKKGGRVSEEQQEWIDAIQGAGVLAFVCRGVDEAIETLEDLMK